MHSFSRLDGCAQDLLSKSSWALHVDMTAMLSLPRIPQGPSAMIPVQSQLTKYENRNRKTRSQSQSSPRRNIGPSPAKPRNGGAGHPESGRVEIKESGPKVWVGFEDASLRES